MKCSVYIATSLDGFIAREDGAIDWLPIPQPGGEDYGYDAFMKTIDAIVIGRHSFDKVLTFEIWPYTKPVVVLTSRPESLPSPLPPRVRGLSGQPAGILGDLERAGAGHVYVDGGITIQRFLAAGKIDRIIITRIPVLIGTGIPLFGRLSRDIRLRHVRTHAFPDGLVQSEYLVSA